MLSGIRKLNVSPSRLTALALLAVVAVTLLNACGGGDSGEDRPTLTITPIPRTITTPPPAGGTQMLAVRDTDTGEYQNMEFDASGVPQFDTLMLARRTYTTTSSAPDVATADVDRDSGVVIVTAVKRGSAEITIFADGDAVSTAASTLARSVSAPSIRAVAAYSFTVEVENRAPTAVGTIDALALNVGLPEILDVASNFNDPDKESLSYTASSSDLAVATVSVSGSVVTVTPVVGGSTTITVTAQDPGGLSATQTITVTVASESKPDLIISSFSAPSKVRVGETFTLSAVVQNLGTGTAGATTLKYYRSTDSTITSGDTQVGADDSVRSLGYLETDSYQDNNILASSSAGTYYYGACVDSVSGETNTDNNCSIAGMVEVDDGSPDLIISSASASVGSLTVGGTFTLNATVRNQGTEDSADTTLKYYRSPDLTITRSDTEVGTDSVSSLVISGVSSKSIDLIAPSLAGAYYYGACVDPVSGETDTNNNCSDGVTVAVTVNPPEIVNQAPVPVGTIAALTFTLGDSAGTRDVVSNFNDPDNDSLAFTVSTSPPAIATARVSGSVVTVTPVAVGSAIITVTAKDPDGQSAIQTIDVTVAAANQAPTAVGTVAAVALTVGDSAATRNVASNFNDPDNDPLAYTASTSASGVATASVIGSEVTVTPVGAGSATITVTAQDPDGLSATQTIDVTVAAANQVPTAVGTVAAVALTVGDSAATRNVASNFNDPDNDPLAYTASTSASGVATASVIGSEVTVTPVGAGSATITVTAQDPDGLSATQTIDVTVAAANQAPTAVGTVAAVALTVGESAVTRDVASNFNDPENDSLTYRASILASGVATASVIGSVVTVTPVGAGSATITVTAQDPDGLSATQTIDVTVAAANQAPTAVGTVAAVALTVGDSAVTRDVASNFNDPENDSLTYRASILASGVATASVIGSVVTVTPVAAGSTTITVTAQDPDGLSAIQTIDVTVAAANQAPTAVGTVAAVALTVGESAVTRDVASNFSDPENDSLTYRASIPSGVATASVIGSVVTVTPVRAGSATITVTAQDPDGLSAIQTIDVTVAAANQAPTAVGTVAAVALTVGGSAATRNVASNFNDPENDSLTYTASSLAPAVATVSVSGSVVTVTPVAGGSTTITVTAQDPGGLSTSQTIAVTVNTAPVAVGTVAAVTLIAGRSAATRDVASNFNDPDNDSLTYTASSLAPAVATVSVSGSVVTVTPVAGGSTTITVTAQDPGGLSTTQTIAVTVAANQAPTAVGTVAAVALTVGDSAVTRDVASNFSDPENDSLTYRASILPSGVATASVIGSVVTVTPVRAGSATITVTAQDPRGLSATQTIDVIVNSAIVYPSSVSAEVSGFDGNPEDRFTILATVNYSGIGIIAPTTAKFYLSSDSTIESSDTEVGEPYDISSSSISGSKNEPVSDRVNAPNSPGTYYYGVCAETATTTPVCSNGVEVVVYVVEPDSVSAEIVSFNGEAGDGFSLRATVHYTGTGTTAETTVKYYLSSDSTITSSDTEVGTDSVPFRSAPHRRNRVDWTRRAKFAGDVLLRCVRRDGYDDTYMLKRG